MRNRAAGILLHPTSLPARYGVGDLGPAADAFLDWLARAGQSVWQMLPVGPPGPGASPYSSPSAFAGSLTLVSPERMLEDGLLDAAALARAPRFSRRRADLARAADFRDRLLRRARERFSARATGAQRRSLESFLDEPRQRAWLDDWALFAALARAHGGRPWTTWDEGLRRRRPGPLREARRALAGEVEHQRFAQFVFELQWKRLKRLARRRGVRLLGDLPFYVADGAADLWSHPELFLLDGRGRPRVVGGVPPDLFSDSGQLWRQPVYDWEALRKCGYRWWVDRALVQLRRFDLLRVDHFRGYAAYWEVPAGHRTAAGGRWRPGPGAKPFAALRRAAARLQLIAEDLGEITPDVHALRRRLGLPGMKVLQFAFPDPGSEHRLEHHEADFAVYTGTHDNDTARGWFASLPAATRREVLAYLDGTPRTIAWDLIRAAHGSVARLAIVPLQDVLGLGSAARMNVPGRARGNWTWRASPGALTDELARDLRGLTERAGRLPRRIASG